MRIQIGQIEECDECRPPMDGFYRYCFKRRCKKFFFPLFAGRRGVFCFHLTHHLFIIGFGCVCARFKSNTDIIESLWNICVLLTMLRIYILSASIFCAFSAIDAERGRCEGRVTERFRITFNAQHVNPLKCCKDLVGSVYLNCLPLIVLSMLL